MPVGIAEVLSRLDADSKNGTATEIFATIDTLQDAPLTDDARLLLEINRAQALALLGDTREAEAVLDTSQSALAQPGSPRSRFDQLVLEAALATSRGLWHLVLGREAVALREFEAARSRFVELGLLWRASAVLINTAIAASGLGDVPGALRLLDACEDEVASLEVPATWREARRGTIGINRSGFRHMAGDRDGAIEELVRARTHVAAAGDLVSLGTVDFNLATLYMEAKRYGSALEAAHSSAASYEQGGSTANRNRALAMLSAALVKMERRREAERILNGILATAPETPQGLERTWVAEALNVLATIYRNTNRVKESDALERARVALGAAPNPETQALEEMFLHFLEVVNAIQAGHPPEPWPERRQALDVVRRSTKHPQAALLAQVLERLLDAIEDGRPPPPLSDEEREMLATVNLTVGEWESMVDSAVGLRVGDDRRTLRAHLGDLVRFQQEVSEQEGPAYRGSMLAARGGQTLDVAVPLLVKHGNFAGLFEVIEWCRRDFGDTAQLNWPQKLMSYADIIGTRADAEGPTALARPTGLTVRGASELRAVVPELPIRAEADRLRADLAGGSAAWWTTMVHRDAVVWALLTPDGTTGGVLPWTSEARTALQLHLKALPVPLSADVEELDLDQRHWCAPTLAIARAASGPLLDDPTLRQRCLAALPSDVAARFNQRRGELPVAAETDVYGPLGDFLIPDAVNEYLDAYGKEASLLISVQPELASVPTCLLRTGDGRPLLARSPVTYAPPIRVATQVTARPDTPGPASTLFAVLNPTSDLAFTPSPPRAETLLGWGAALSRSEVATTANVVAGLGALSSERQPTAFAFVGHIRSGVASDPGAAALALAPEEPTGQPAFLRASSLTTGPKSMPDRVYLGGCEGSGFGTSLEWSSVAAASLAGGATNVLAHRWPIVEGASAAAVDRECIAVVRSVGDVAEHIRRRQSAWWEGWRERQLDAVAPHYWAGLQVIGRSVAAPR